MDDVAASEQLMSEKGTRIGAAGSIGTLSQVDGSQDASPLIQKKRKRNSALGLTKKSVATSPTKGMLAQDDVPASSPFPFPATQPEPESPAANGFTHATAVEVPDSQIPGRPAQSTASSPMSSHVIPSSATKGKRTYKQSKQSKRDRAISDAMQEADIDQDGDTTMIADEAASPSHTASKNKRSQETEVAPGTNGLHSRKAARGGADGTPSSAKRRKIGTPKSLTTLRDLIGGGEDEDAEQLRTVQKSKLKRIKKPQTPVAKSRNLYEIPDDDPRPTNGEASTMQTATPKPRLSLKKTKKNKDSIDNRPTPVRTPAQPSGEEEDEDSIIREPISSDEADVAPPSGGDHRDFKEKKKTKKRRSSAKKATSRRESGRYSFTWKDPPSGTAAERALNVEHDLQHPPDLRSSGDFTADEEELIRRAIVDYQQRKGLDVSELVDIIQWNPTDPSFNTGDGTISSKSEWAPQDIEDARESAEFWDDIKHLRTERSQDRLRRHIRQTYHQFKRGVWTEEEDKRLKQLYAMHPNKWKVISVGMGDRSMHDCQNRWRDYLQYGDKLKSSRWDEEEEELFIRAVTAVAQRDEDHRAEEGLPPIDKYTMKDINWQQVSHEMDNTRSRIQVVQKWRNLQKRESPPEIEVERKPRKEKPAASKSAIPEPTPKKRGRPKGEAGATPKPNPHSARSQEVIHNSDDEEARTLLPPKKAKRPSKSEGSEVKKPKKFRTAEIDEIVDGSDEEGQASKEADSPPKKKKRRKSQKSEAAEADDDEESRPTKTRDVIENSDEENAQADQQSKVSPPPKKRGPPRKSDTLESNEPEKRTELEVSEESVADLELANDDQSEHAEGDDKAVEETQPVVQETQVDPALIDPALIDPALDLNRAQSLTTGDDAEQEIEEPSDEEEPFSTAPIISPEQPQTDGNDEVQEQNENSIEDDDPIEDDEDQHSVASSSSSQESDDDQSEQDSKVSAPTENDELPGEEVQTGVTSADPDGEKLTVNAGDKMQWGDKYDLIASLQNHRDDREEDGDFNWDKIAEEVAAERKYMWTPQVLQTALDQLIQLLRDNCKEVDEDDLDGTVDDIMDFISSEHGEQLDEYYDLS
ncbi:hypothetical protein J4E90_005174 [Alternaria incomplexa]|uniref:uncharacterized protein n=1 Tax=Alternaria incomplexa TaxID=1187928 RepID=UPI002220EBF0|nr:uncharacterized protein J4E90_005174 [Alternaria incomplexa]KAI4915135.1 hypothetical protein J4E90_005174 [Alternaria incomplexa]